MKNESHFENYFSLNLNNFDFYKLVGTVHKIVKYELWTKINSTESIHEHYLNSEQS